MSFFSPPKQEMDDPPPHEQPELGPAVVPWKTETTAIPTSSYVMPTVPPGYDWKIDVFKSDVQVTLRKEHRAVRSQVFHWSSDPYIVAAHAVVTGEEILNGLGPLGHVNLSCLDNFTPGVGVSTS